MTCSRTLFYWCRASGQPSNELHKWILFALNRPQMAARSGPTTAGDGIFVRKGKAKGAAAYPHSNFDEFEAAQPVAAQLGELLWPMLTICVEGTWGQELRYARVRGGRCLAVGFKTSIRN